MNMASLVALLIAMSALVVGCGKSYKDSPPINPLQTDKVIDLVRYRASDAEAERVIQRRHTDGFINLFNESRLDPAPEAWRFVANLHFRDSDDNTTILVLYQTPEGVPDGYQLGETYYVRDNLLADLEAWLTEREKRQSPRRR